MPNVSLRVSRGILWTDDTPVTSSALNQTGLPVVELEPGAGIAPEHLDMAALVAALADPLRAANIMPFADFAPPGWLAPDGISVPAGTASANAAGWEVRPVSDAVTYARAEAAPNTSSTYAAQINGSASLSSVDLRVWLDSSVTGLLRNQPVTFSAWVYNASTGPLRPILVLETPTVLDDQTTLVAVYSVTASALQEIAANSWGRVTWTDDTTLRSNYRLGARYSLRFPGAQLNAPARYVQVAQVQLERGVVVTPWIPPGTPAVANTAWQPGMGTEWHGSALPAGGWLWQNGQAVSRTLYPRLFAAIGTAYGSGDGTSTFNVPDRRGRTGIGVETMGGASAAGRAEVILTGCELATSTLMTVPAASRARIAPGMGVFGPGVPGGTTVSHFSGRSGVVLTAAPTFGTNPATVRFSALAASDPEVRGAAGAVAAAARHDLILRGCGITAASATITVLPDNVVDVGSEVVGDGIPAGTTVLAYGANARTLVLSDPATASNAAATLTFIRPDTGSGSAAGELAADLSIRVNGCATAATTTVTVPVTDRIFPGMLVTGSGIPVGAHVVSKTVSTVVLSVAATASATVDLTFSAASPGQALAPSQIAALAVGYIIKT
jgi:microcystin-dependent protein